MCHTYILHSKRLAIIKLQLKIETQSYLGFKARTKKLVWNIFCLILDTKWFLAERLNILDNSKKQENIGEEMDSKIRMQSLGSSLRSTIEQENQSWS